MKFVIRDDDTCFFTRSEQIEKVYGKIWNEIPVSLSIVPFHACTKSGPIPKKYWQGDEVFPIENNKNLVEFLKEKIREGKISIMLHGYSHKDYEEGPEFVAGKPLFGRVKYPINQFKTEYCASPYWRDLCMKLPRAGKIMQLDLKLFTNSCLKLLKNSDDYDLIQTCGIPGIVALKSKKNNPIVLRFPGPPSLKYKKQIERADAVIADGDAFFKIKESIRKDVVNITPGVNCEIFKPIKNRIKSQYHVEDKEILLFVGRFVPAKNLFFLIKTFREIVKERKNVRLMLVGEGPFSSLLKTMITGYGLGSYVIFTGKINHQQTAAFYSSADIFLMPSIYDNFPIAILEAMSCELPVIATKVGGIPLIIKHGENGFLVEADNVTQFTKAIITLLDSKSLAKEMGQKNREEIKKKYNWFRSAKKLKGIYESLLR